MESFGSRSLSALLCGHKSDYLDEAASAGATPAAAGCLLSLAATHRGFGDAARLETLASFD